MRLSIKWLCLLGMGFLIHQLGYSQGTGGGLPTLSIGLKDSTDPTDTVAVIKIIALMTVLTVAPAILLMMTSFTRLIVVLSFVRQALGTQTMPPNQVIVGLSLFLTFFIMTPVFNEINEKALTPYLNKTITQDEALTAFISPVRKWMIKQTKPAELGLMLNVSAQKQPNNVDEVSTMVIIPAFVLSELKTAFLIGFLIYIPFLIIDMVVSSVLMAMGMLMLPPTVVSLPFKLILFVLIDGWSLIVGSLVKSFS